jgi:hypothetical protein
MVEAEEKAVPFWEIQLRQCIKDQLIADAMAMDVNACTDAFEKLLNQFGPSDQLRERARRQLVRQLNSDPINESAKKWLPISYQSDDVLHILSLMQWGVVEGGIAPAYWETPDYCSELIINMQGWNPAFVMAVMQNPECPEQSEEESSLCFGDLERQADANGAACVLLEQLESAVRNDFGGENA